MVLQYIQQNFKTIGLRANRIGAWFAMQSFGGSDFGETLSWNYYEYAKAHPITKWQCRTDILYAENDRMTSQNMV